jgi:hypothetical protein
LKVVIGSGSPSMVWNENSWALALMAEPPEGKRKIPARFVSLQRRRYVNAIPLF